MELVIGDQPVENLVKRDKPVNVSLMKMKGDWHVGFMGMSEKGSINPRLTCPFLT